MGIWRQHRVLMSALVIAALLTVFFAVRSVMFTIYWADPAHRDQALAGWMTPGHVLNSWNIDQNVMLAAIGPAAQPGKPQTLKEIAKLQNETLETLIARIETAIVADRASRP